jgi:hypothetical protein
MLMTRLLLLLLVQVAKGVLVARVVLDVLDAKAAKVALDVLVAKANN